MDTPAFEKKQKLNFLIEKFNLQLNNLFIVKG